MLYRLYLLHRVPFVETRALIAALVGGLGSGALAWGTFGMTIKTLPGIESLSRSVQMPVFSDAATYAVGMAFIRHFESGGTFLDLDPSKARNEYAIQFRKEKERLL